MNKGEYSELFAVLQLISAFKIRLYGTQDFSFIDSIAWNGVSFKENSITSNTGVTLPLALLQAIREFVSHEKSSKVSFEQRVNNLIIFLKKHNLDSKTANSSSKSDVSIILKQTGSLACHSKAEFNIKSWMGQAPSLFNASKSAIIRYCLSPIETQNKSKLLELSSKKIRHNLHKASTLANIKLSNAESPIFQENLNNLGCFDTVGNILVKAYLQNEFKIARLTNTTKDRLGWANFLDACSAGMTAGAIYDPGFSKTAKATVNNLILVSPSEDLFLVQGRDDVKNFLLKNSKFDTPSTSRHDFGYVYSDDAQNILCLDIALQIRLMSWKQLS